MYSYFGRFGFLGQVKPLLPVRASTRSSSNTKKEKKKNHILALAFQEMTSLSLGDN